mmetsp:Transcript_13339/g.19237  ORF Transcript_13339/g.19237 Transcript_13339/m.19237 type:complete len:474 (-) Transcript_13339:76-1497(-)
MRHNSERPFGSTKVGRGSLILLLAFLAFSFGSLGADLFVVLLEGGKVLAGLGEFAFLHAFTDVPVDERTLGVHEVELVVDAGQSLGDSGRVGNHAASAHDLGEVASGDDGRGLVVDTALEAGGAPVDELDGALGLDGGDRGVDVLGDDVTAVHQAARHVLAVAGIALSEHGAGLEDRVGDLCDGELLVVRLLGRDDRGVGRKHEVDTRVGHQVGLELGDVDVEGAIEAEGGREGRHDLRDDAVEVGVRRALDVEAAAAHVVDGLVVKAEGHIGVLQEGVGGKDVVVGLDDSSGDLGGRGDGEGQLGLLAVVDGEALEEQGTEAGAGTATSGVVDEEALEAGAVVGELADAVEDEVNDFLADGVVTTGVVVGGVFLAGDQLFRVVQLAVGAGADLVNDGGLEVDVDGTGDVLASTSLREEGVEGVVAATDGLVGWHLAVRLDTMLQAKEFPGGVTDLATCLADLDVDDFAHLAL